MYRRPFRYLSTVATLLTAYSSLSLGAEVSIGQEPILGDSIVNISGKIEKGDLTKIKKTSAQLISSLSEYSNKSLVFHLNTPGGDIEEAMGIGKFARDILATVDSYGTNIIGPGSSSEKFLIEREDPWIDRDYVILDPNSTVTEKHIVRNYSAGILIFYGAAKRAHRDNTDQRLGFELIPVMGIHRPYYESEAFSKLSPAQASQAYKKLERMVRDYLAEMGAPQALIDRMFNKASNEIELIGEVEFRKYYKPEESFLSEWLIAKCGSVGSQNVFKDKELIDFEKISMEQSRLRRADKDSVNKPIMNLYPSVNFSQEYVEDLYKKIRHHNVSVNSCRAKAVSFHQREWARNYRE